MASKKWLSIAAAGILAAGVFTGCGDDDSSSTTNDTSSVTSFTGDKKALVNALGTAVCTNSSGVENNVTLTSTLFVSNAATGAQTLGSNVYSIPSTATCTTIKYIMLQNRDDNTSTIDGVTYNVPATFDDGALNGVVDGNFSASNDTRLLTSAVTGGSDLIFRAPAGVGISVVSPASELVFQLVDGSVDLDGNLTELNTSFVTSIENNLTRIANAVGVSTSDLKTFAVSSASNYSSTAQERLETLNSVIRNSLTATDGLTSTSLSGLATALSALGGSAASSLDSVLSNVSSALTTAGDTVRAANVTAIREAVAQYDSETAFRTALQAGSINMEKSITDGQLVKSAGSSTTADLNVTDIRIGSTDIGSLDATGAKITLSDLNSTVLDFDRVNGDSNSTFNVDLIVYVAKPEAWESAAEFSDELVVKVSNLEVNATTISSSSGTTAPSVKTTSSTRISVKGLLRSISDTNTTYNSVSVSDANLTAFGTTAARTLTSTGDGNVTFLVHGILEAVDNNVSSTTTSGSNKKFGSTAAENTVDFQNVGSLAVLLTDSSSKLERVSSANTVLNWIERTVTASDGTAYTGKTILNLQREQGRLADTRGATTGANAAPDVNVTLNNAEDNISGYRTVTGTTWSTTQNNANEYNGTGILYNIDTTVADKITKFIIEDTTAEGRNGGVERNMTVTLTESSDYFSVSTPADDGSNRRTFTLTADSNNSTTAALTTSGELSATMTISATDEFGKTSSSKDKNITVRLNRAPNWDFNTTSTLSDGSSYTVSLDLNLSTSNVAFSTTESTSLTDKNGTGSVLNDTENNLSNYALYFFDYDGVSDVNETSSFTDVNLTATIACTSTANDFNTSPIITYQGPGASFNILWKDYNGSNTVRGENNESNATLYFTEVNASSSTTAANYRVGFLGQVTTAATHNPNATCNLKLTAYDKFLNANTSVDRNISLTLSR